MRAFDESPFAIVSQHSQKRHPVTNERENKRKKLIIALTLVLLFKFCHLFCLAQVLVFAPLLRNLYYMNFKSQLRNSRIIASTAAASDTTTDNAATAHWSPQQGMIVRGIMATVLGGGVINCFKKSREKVLQDSCQILPNRTN